MTDNKPPYVVLELDKNQSVMLHRLLLRDRSQQGIAFREVCEMSSSDPRSAMRSSATMMLAGDMDFDESMTDAMTNQQPDLIETNKHYETLLKIKEPK